MEVINNNTGNSEARKATLILLLFRAMQKGVKDIYAK